MSAISARALDEESEARHDNRSYWYVTWIAWQLTPIPESHLSQLFRKLSNPVTVRNNKFRNCPRRNDWCRSFSKRISLDSRKGPMTPTVAEVSAKKSAKVVSSASRSATRSTLDQQ